MEQFSSNRLSEAAATKFRPRPYVGFFTALKKWVLNIFHFSGRASRSEFWWVQLFWVVIFGLYAVSSWFALTYFGSDEPRGEALTPLEGTILALLVFLPVAMFITTLALGWRRLHDAGFPGLLYLLQVIGIAGIGLVPLILCIFPPDPRGYKYDKPVDRNRP